MSTSNIKPRIENVHEYPLEKARKILEQDGTFLSDDELEQLVNVLTLLARNEAESSNRPNTKTLK